MRTAVEASAPVPPRTRSTASSISCCSLSASTPVSDWPRRSGAAGGGAVLEKEEEGAAVAGRSSSAAASARSMKSDLPTRVSSNQM